MSDPRLRFGYNQGLPEYVEAAWGCQANINPDGTIDLVSDRISTYGQGDAVKRLEARLDSLGRGERWRKRAEALLVSGIMDPKVAAEHVLVDDGVVVIKANTNSFGHLCVCAYDAYQRVPEPEIPDGMRVFLAHYLRWLANDDGTHGGMQCRWDRADLAERADRIQPGPVKESLGDLVQEMP